MPMTKRRKTMWHCCKLTYIFRGTPPSVQYTINLHLSSTSWVYVQKMHDSLYSQYTPHSTTTHGIAVSSHARPTMQTLSNAPSSYTFASDCSFQLHPLLCSTYEYAIYTTAYKTLCIVYISLILQKCVLLIRARYALIALTRTNNTL